jgi:S1-C subfamily serine protease
VPVNDATRAIVGALIADGVVRRARLGIAVAPRPLAPSLAAKLGRERAVEVTEVVEEGAAARAGLRAGDLLLALDGVALEDATDLQRLMVADRIGRALDAVIARDGIERLLRITPDELVV